MAAADRGASWHGSSSGKGAGAKHARAKDARQSRAGRSQTRIAMTCQNHPDVAATAYCRTCGKPVCDQCRRDAYGTVYCEEHAPAPSAAVPPASAHGPGVSHAAGVPAGAAPPFAYARRDVSPGLALVLGFIPGVGAIYNGQYAKGLIHAVIFGLMVSVASMSHSVPVQAFVGIMIGIWVFYQAFESYHTARKRRYGIAVEEFSSLFDV